jgi:hypothetical protein
LNRQDAKTPRGKCGKEFTLASWRLGGSISASPEIMADKMRIGLLTNPIFPIQFVTYAESRGRDHRPNDYYPATRRVGPIVHPYDL